MVISQLVCIGASAGGVQAATRLIEGLRPAQGRAVVLILHVSPHQENQLPEILGRAAELIVLEAVDKVKIEENTVYVAPPNYHLLVERDHSLSLSSDERVCYARPSVNVTFETAAEAFFERTVGIILTGANSDGASGLKHLHDLGGMCIVQDPEEALVEIMPRAAIGRADPQMILSIEAITEWLNTHPPEDKGEEG